jgi:CheY-like chemotaxis protein
MSTDPGIEAADVLIVEDDGDLRGALAECLRLEGYCVAEASDGADALACLRDGARPALILLDLIMPRMDGRQFLGAVREEGGLARIPVVLVTGTPPQDLEERSGDPDEADRRGRSPRAAAAVRARVALTGRARVARSSSVPPR